ncbi:hypothetical protein LK994_09580 [Ferruginibacter lapsinanis]|uniref:hypothetical protein n=1 Tax=Ferruginibacter lapsinanis TaxID=563172 RepID=UPI001E3DB51D|nr:hypothetical protein [Ferruginibacter lapsinanis]UEG48887.1 hypothetical protein LK994_09580 [Ferruginibacter lapsinanis]
MKRIIILAIVLITFSQQQVSAQSRGSSYTTALGVKFYPGAITVKHFVKTNRAIEGIGYFWERGSRITGLYEIHGDIKNARGLKWYIGPGAHLGFYKTKYYGGGTTVGVDGVLGLDYKFNDAPINLSLDWQPSFEFGDYAGFSGNWGGLAIRYTF